ncbi:hypothetical protein [Undibacter mobilis]|nr:hypothetical protein [Undibacter mobilis]
MDAVTQCKVLSWEDNCGAELAFPPEPPAMANGRGNVDKIFVEGGKGCCR